MPLSTDVNLPRAHPATFPDRCVRCGSDPRGRTVGLWTHTIGWLTPVFWLLGRGFSVRVPACRRCGIRIRLQRVGGVLLMLAVATLFLFLVWPYLDERVPRELRKWVAMASILVCVSPWLLWEVIHPPSIDVTAFSSSVDYEFRDADYAREFAELNADADWVKVE